jgi:hypothetical protein
MKVDVGILYGKTYENCRLGQDQSLVGQDGELQDQHERRGQLGSVAYAMPKAP